MNFHETRFPAPLSIGSSGGPERRTEIVTLSNGFEERNSPWLHSRRRYDAGLGVKSLDDLADVIAFFEARHGQLYGFRWKDWTDFKSGTPSSRTSPTDQLCGTGDGVQKNFSLVKQYVSGKQAYERPINKPVSGTVLVAVDGVHMKPGTDFAVNHTVGLVAFADAPAKGAAVHAGFEFDVPVRFDSDRINASLAGFAAGEIPSIPVVEVRI